MEASLYKLQSKKRAPREIAQIIEEYVLLLIESEEISGFSSGRSWIDNILCIKQVAEKSICVRKRTSYNVHRFIKGIG